MDLHSRLERCDSCDSIKGRLISPFIANGIMPVNSGGIYIYVSGLAISQTHVFKMAAFHDHSDSHKYDTI